MARLPRLIVPGQPQHFIVRGNNRSEIFCAEADYRFYLEKLQQDCDNHACGVTGVSQVLTIQFILHSITAWLVLYVSNIPVRSIMSLAVAKHARLFIETTMTELHF